MARLRDLVNRAGGGRLHPAELADATITATNLGGEGVESVFGLIYPPQVAFVGIGKFIELPVAVGRPDWRPPGRGHYPFGRSPGERRIHRRPLPGGRVRTAATTGGAVTPEQPRNVIDEAVSQIAPDADVSSLAPDTDLRDALELDSLDFLNLVEALSQRTGRQIDEDDYPQLATLARAVKFLAVR